MEWLFYLPWNRKSTKGVREELGSYITLHSVFDFLRTGHVSIAQDSRTLMAEQSQNGLHLVSHGFARLGHTLEMAALRTPRGTSLQLLDHCWRRFAFCSRIAVFLLIAGHILCFFLGVFSFLTGAAFIGYNTE